MGTAVPTVEYCWVPFGFDMLAAHQVIIALPVFVTGFLIGTSHSKQFERCELAGEFIKLGLPQDQLNDWLCLVEGESRYNSTARRKHENGVNCNGLFQVCEKWWCDSTQFGTKPKGCRIPCSALFDDDITDDVECAKHIHKEWKAKPHGNGFLAWGAWKRKCQGRNLSSYSKDCPNLNARRSHAWECPRRPCTTDSLRPRTLKEIVLGQGGEELRSLWDNFFGKTN